MKLLKKLSTLLFAIAISSSLASCNMFVQPKSVTINKAELKLVMGQTETLTAKVNPTNASQNVSWSIDDDEIATISAAGLVTPLSSGSATITATAKGGKVFDTCALTVSPEWHDYVKDGSVQLNLPYTGKDFFNDGVEKVSLLTPIDGDTAHFTTSSGKTLKARFYGIDTPESTGKVQPYGKKASNFTKEKLQAANKNGTIVVSSPATTYGAPSPDSTGSRYVSLIWVNLTTKNAPLSELYLLNLWIVQEGLSLVKNVSDIPEYEDAFWNASNQAEAYKKMLWSGEKDSDFNYDSGYQDVSLLDIKREVEKSIADSTYVNAYNNVKVRFTGVVSGYADGTLYMQEFYPVDDDNPTVGEWAGINIFCGMSAISTKFTKPNTYLEVYGLAQDSETFGFQITDTQGHWAAYAAGETDCKVLLKADLNTEEHSLYTFHYTVSELNNVASNSNFESLFCSVQVEGEVTCDYAYVSEDRAITLGFSDTTWGVYIPYAYHGDQSTDESKVIRWDEESDFVGKKFRIDSGTYAWHRTTSGKVRYQIIPTSETSFVWIDE